MIIIFIIMMIIFIIMIMGKCVGGCMKPSITPIIINTVNLYY